MIVLCVTGSIAATESIKLARELRRNDFDVFSMSTYMSCENCRHLNGENQCEKKLEENRNV